MFDPSGDSTLPVVSKKRKIQEVDEQDTEVAVKAKKFKAEMKGWLLYLCCCHVTASILQLGLAVTASHTTWVFSLRMAMYLKKWLTPDCSQFTSSCKCVRTFKNKTLLIFLQNFLLSRFVFSILKTEKLLSVKPAYPIFFQEYYFILCRSDFWHFSTYKKVRIWLEMTLGNFRLNLCNTWTIVILWRAKTELCPQLFFLSLISYCVTNVLQSQLRIYLV